MHVVPIRKRPPTWTRFIAGLAVFLMLGLVVFSASPAAHSWLHGGDKVSSVTKAAPHQTGHESAKDRQQDEDACAIVLFSSGILAVVVFFVLARLSRRVVQGPFFYVAPIHRATPRYWLPPLCGPPLN
jgi:hypothetical protein